MRIALKQSQLGLRNSKTRIPFRYGSACLTACPQAVLGVTIEVDGRCQRGYSGDCLPPGWFDKSPARDYRGQIEDMLAAIGTAEQVFADQLARAAPFFAAWRTAGECMSEQCTALGMTPLLASFGFSLVERAILDAACRAADISFAQALRANVFGLVPGDVHSELAGVEPCAWLPRDPVQAVYVRHTVGLADPLTTADIAPDQRLEDGFPHALEEYLHRTGVQFFKVKVSGKLDADLERLTRIAELAQRSRGPDYRVTLDGNEQYKRAEQFDELVEAIQSEPALRTFWENTLVIEQPLARDIALDPTHTDGIRRLANCKPVIIDESDGTLDAYARAIELGYRGVSSKACKGAIKSVLNAGLTWLNNGRQHHGPYIMTGEDLCSVGIIPVQSDLCLAATLGLEHVERNGHHYHRGLSYLPAAQQEAALRAHSDLYARQNGTVSPQVVDGKFRIASLQCRGFGFAVEPDFGSMETPDQWQFESLGL